MPAKLLTVISLIALALPVPRVSSDAIAGAPTLSTSSMQAEEDIDAFMQKVLERRDVNWDQLYDYVFSEVESLRIKGLEIAAMQSLEEEYTWFVREGYLVRSPWKMNGVAVDDAERDAAERAWIERVKNDERGARIERDSFFDFKFEPGNYLFAGREMFEGREVVRIEYYPEHLFSDAGEAGGDENTAGGDRANPGGDRATAGGDRATAGGEEQRADEDADFDEEAFEHMFDKTSLVTMLVIPEEHQIVKWTFENAGFEFLPYRWLVRMDEIRASMVLHQPIEGVWLPREIHASASASTASFDVSFEYGRSFSDYKRTEVGAGVVFGRPKH